MSDSKCFICESTGTLVTQKIDDSGKEQRICTKCSAEKMNAEEKSNDAAASLPVSTIFKEPKPLKTDPVVLFTTATTIPNLDRNKTMKSSETEEESDDDDVGGAAATSVVVVDDITPNAKEEDNSSLVNKNHNVANDEEHKDIIVAVVDKVSTNVESKELKKEAVNVLPPIKETKEPSLPPPPPPPPIALPAQALPPPLLPLIQQTDDVIPMEISDNEGIGDVDTNQSKTLTKQKGPTSSLPPPPPLAVAAPAVAIENGSSQVQITKTITRRSAVTTRGKSLTTMVEPKPKPMPIPAAKTSPTMVRRLRKSTRATRFRSRMSATGNGSASGNAGAAGAGPSGLQNHHSHHHLTYNGSAGSGTSGNIYNSPVSTSGKGQNKGGRNRRTLFKRQAVKTPIMHASTRCVNSVFFQGSYLQVGDIVSLVDSDNMLYYAQIRGLLVDAYCEKSAFLSWLIPTQDSPNPKEGFDPATYLIGPDEDFSRKLSYLKFVMHAPSNYFHDRTTPFPLPDAMDPVKQPGGYIWTHLPMDKSDQDTELRTDDD